MMNRHLLTRYIRKFSTDKKTIEKQEELLFPRTLQALKQQVAGAEQPAEASAFKVVEAEIDDWDQTLMTLEELEQHGEKWRKAKGLPAEHGFGYRGNEPTMFGDWQHKGRTTDF